MRLYDLFEKNVNAELGFIFQKRKLVMTLIIIIIYFYNYIPLICPT